MNVNQVAANECLLRLPPVLGVYNSQKLFELAYAFRQATGRVVLDATELEFVDPLGLAVLGVLLESPRSTPPVRIDWMATSVASYLDRMGLFERCTVEGVEIPRRARRDQRTNLVELTCVNELHRADDVANDISSAITGQLTSFDPNEAPDATTGLTKYDAARHTLQYVFSELLDNSLTHARRDGCIGSSVWVAAQHWPSRGIVRVAVVDNGCGVLRTLKHHSALTCQTHQAAILAGLLPKVSCNRDVGVMSDSVNQGVGLTTAKRIVEAAGGSMAIVSGDGHVTSKHSRTLPRNAFWAGVAVTFTVERLKLPTVAVADLLPAQDSPPVRVRFE